MPPGPIGIGAECMRLFADVEHCVETLADAYLVEPELVRGAIIQIHQNSVLSLADITRDGGHHELHKVLCAAREGDVVVPRLARPPIREAGENNGA